MRLLLPKIFTQFVQMVYELQRTIIDWEYKAEPSRRYSISSGGGNRWPRGLVLGGSGTINAMKYVRGNDRDYDMWEQMGNEGWGWDEVLGYFKKSEDNQIDALVNYKNGKFHSRGGYLSVDYFDTSDPMNGVLNNAARELGFNELFDLNADEHVGYGRSVFTIVNATRCSPAKAFLSPIKGRKNLHVIKHAFVTSLLFAADDNKVQGVNFVLRNRREMMAIAKREVILSAGTINTAKILQLSGIGKQSLLTALKINQRAELSVGDNLQDHVTVPLFIKFNKSSRKKINLNIEKILNLFEFLMKNRSQPLTNHDVSSVLIFANTVNASDRYPDVQMEFYQLIKGGLASILLTESFGYNPDIVESIHRAESEADVVVARINILRPRSRGKLYIQSTDPYVDPVIEPNYFKDYEDLKTLIRAIRIMQQMFATDSFRQNEAELHRVNLKGCMFIQYNTDEYWECYIRHLTLTLYHPAGTAKMGPDNDSDAVVDSRLRVKQIEKLRVVDASIMPDIVSANLNAPTIMIGEKGSDLIKEDNGF